MNQKEFIQAELEDIKGAVKHSSRLITKSAMNDDFAAVSTHNAYLQALLEYREYLIKENTSLSDLINTK